MNLLKFVSGIVDRMKQSATLALAIAIVIFTYVIVSSITFYDQRDTIKRDQIIQDKLKEKIAKYEGIVDSSNGLALLYDIKTSLDSLKQISRSIYGIYKLDRKIDTLISKTERDTFKK